jgi:uridine kinase
MAELSKMTIISIDDLEDSLGVAKFGRFATACELEFDAKIQTVVDQVLQKTATKAIFVSGPTASGKTTFSRRLAATLTSLGRPTRVVSLDDYYTTEGIRYDSWGRPDFESIETLDTDLVVRQFNDLMTGQKVALPQFDFVSRRRTFPENMIMELTNREIVLVEGLHGLSPCIAGQLPRDSYLGIFIMPWCSLLSERQLLGSRDLRILRRISRDVVHRGSTALSTIDYWPMIDKTEQIFFPTYLASADIYINSCLPYEFCIVAPKAYRQISQSLQQYEDDTLPGSIYHQLRSGYADLPMAVAEARFLAAACEQIPMIDHLAIPPRSILHEFI